MDGEPGDTVFVSHKGAVHSDFMNHGIHVEAEVADPQDPERTPLVQESATHFIVAFLNRTLRDDASLAHLLFAADEHRLPPPYAGQYAVAHKRAVGTSTFVVDDLAARAQFSDINGPNNAGGFTTFAHGQGDGHERVRVGDGNLPSAFAPIGNITGGPGFRHADLGRSIGTTSTMTSTLGATPRDLTEFDALLLDVSHPSGVTRLSVAAHLTTLVAGVPTVSTISLGSIGALPVPSIETRGPRTLRAPLAAFLGDLSCVTASPSS